MNPAQVIEREFPRRANHIYLNHAGISPWPRRAADAVAAFAQENYRDGPIHYERWSAIEASLREQGRALLNATAADDIALLKNTSEGLSVVAYGMRWESGDNVLTTDQEFPSNRIVWQSLADQGVELREAAIGAAADPEAALFALADERTRLITVSSVQFASGLRMDLARIGAFCRQHDIVFCIDGIQSLGALRLDVEAIQADVVVADGHKWMLGPEGIALFYTRPGLRERLRLTRYGWHMVEALGDYDRRDWTIDRGARRFECGSPNMLGIHGLNASLGLLLEVGMDRVERTVLDNTNDLIGLIDAADNLELISPRQESRRSGIVTFRHKGMDAAALFRVLRDSGIQCAQRGGGIRYSPHFYTPREQLEQAVRKGDGGIIF
jgi:cysteine desulfurase / selenocysteine lyase